MAEAKHSGGCHCGKVRFEAAIDLDRTIQCNCSICNKRGSILTAAPAEKFKLLSGENNLVDYQFNKYNVHHLFCSTCGTESFARGKKPDGTEMVMVNARCLDDIDFDQLKITPFDGKSF